MGASIKFVETTVFFDDHNGSLCGQRDFMPI